jgi:hypothetical protein
VHTINAAAHRPPRSLLRAFAVGWGSPDRCVLSCGVLRSLMFVPGCPVMESGSANFISPREAMGSPLAKKLFAIEGEHVPNTLRRPPSAHATAPLTPIHLAAWTPCRRPRMLLLCQRRLYAARHVPGGGGGAGVKGVFFGSDFVTVSKEDSDDAAWAVRSNPLPALPALQVARRGCCPLGLHLLKPSCEWCQLLLHLRLLCSSRRRPRTEQRDEILTAASALL